jgi:hypothetical protein
MNAFDYIAFVAMAAVFVGLVYIVILLGDLPANVAQERNHPQVAAIRAMAWLGLLFTGGVVYIIALVWAFYDYNHAIPIDGHEAQVEIESLRNRIAALEKELVGKGDAS